MFALARNPNGSEGLQALVKAHQNVVAIKLDIDSTEDWKQAADAVGKATGGKLDVLIHNAADLGIETAGLAPAADADKAELIKSAILSTMQTNVLSVLDGTNAFLPLLLAGKEKKLIAISTAFALPEVSLQAQVAMSLPYSASKAALNILVAKYAVELKPKGVKVLAISPGWVKTYGKSGRGWHGNRLIFIRR